MSILINEFAIINNIDILNNERELPLFFSLAPLQEVEYEIKINKDMWILMPHVDNVNLVGALRGNIGIQIENTRIDRRLSANNYIYLENFSYAFTPASGITLWWAKYQLDFFVKAGDYLKISLINYDPINTYTFNLAFYYHRDSEYYKDKPRLLPCVVPLAQRNDPASLYTWTVGSRRTFPQDFRRYKQVYCYGPILNESNQFLYYNYMFDWNIQFDDQVTLLSYDADFFNFCFNTGGIGLSLTKSPFYRWEIERRQFDINITNLDVVPVDLRSYSFLFMTSYED